MEAIRTLPASSAVIFNNINASTEAFRTIVTAISVASYVWLAAVTTMAVGALQPELSMMKRIAISAASVIIVSVVLIFLVGTV